MILHKHTIDTSLLLSCRRAGEGETTHVDALSGFARTCSQKGHGERGMACTRPDVMVCRVWARPPGCRGHACAEQGEGGTTRTRPDVVGLSGFAVRNMLVLAIFAVENQGQDQN